MTVCMSWLRKAGGVMVRSSRDVAVRRACRNHSVCLASCAATCVRQLGTDDADHGVGLLEGAK